MGGGELFARIHDGLDDPTTARRKMGILAHLDEMRDGDGRVITAHSLNPVPLLLAGAAVRGARLRDGVLADVAPTLLELVGVAPPPTMTGRSLLER